MTNDHTPPAPGDLSLTADFNQRSTDVCEVELKYLVENNDPQILQNTATYFKNKGWVLFETVDRQLLSRQFDTADMLLNKHGKSIRKRGNCQNNDISTVTTPDVCVKAGKSIDDSNAVRRGEYEARTQSFEDNNFDALRTKYSRDKYPELYEVLDIIDQNGVQEHFRIDCMRSRYLIEIPESEHGIKGKRFIAELETDRVVFVTNDVTLHNNPIVIGLDLEVESEMLTKPCAYNDDRTSAPPVSSPMTRVEGNQCMSVMNKHILIAGGTYNAAAGTKNALSPNIISKSERGFIYKQALLDKLQMLSSPEESQRILENYTAKAQRFHTLAHIIPPADTRIIPFPVPQAA